MHPRMLLRALVFCAVGSLSLFSAPAFAQDLPAPTAPALDAVVKPDRDAPFPAPPDAASMAAAAANLPNAVAGVDQWSKLAFQSFRDGNWEIYVTKGDGSAPVNLSWHPGADARPQLNFGAMRVAFNSNRDGNVEIYAVNTDGTGLTRLTYDNATDYAPVWSPDGKRIAFVSNRTGNYDIWVMNADGSSPVQLTFGDSADTGPIWSPDGQWIIWKRTSDGELQYLLIMRSDGSDVESLSMGLRYTGDLHWSPDGKELLIDADVDSDNWNELLILRNMSEISWDLWEIEQVVDVQQPLVDLWAGAYAPDGKWFAFSLVQYGIGRQGLYLARADILNRNRSTGETSRFPGSGSDLNPSWMSADASAPTSHVEPLPAFVRVGRDLMRVQTADQGGSGVRSYDVQYATTAEGPWIDLGSDLTAPQASLPAVEPGSTIWLRSRAKDYAGNVETWPPMADAQTQTYRWEVFGRGVDSRGVAVPNGALNSTPAAVLVNSGYENRTYQLLFTGTQTHTLSMTAPGYTAAAPTALDLNADIRLDLFLPPAMELIRNGGFEDGTAAWAGDGIPVMGGLASGAHSGSNSLRLGPDCVSPCLSALSVPELPVGSHDLIADGRGNLHVVTYVRSQSEAVKLLYQVRSIETGFWSKPEVIGQLPQNGSLMDTAIAIDGQGAVYVAYSLIPYSSAKIPWYLAEKLPGSSWTPFTELTSEIENDGVRGSHFNLPMVGDPVAGVHIILRNRVYLRRLPDGSWAQGIDLYPPGPFSYIPYNKLAVGSDGVVHFITDIEHTITYRSLSPQGVLSAPIILTGDNLSFHESHLLAGRNGGLHLILGRNYRYRNAAGFWTEPQLIAGGLADVGSLGAWVDNADTLHIVGIRDSNSPIYVAKTSDAGWLPLQSLDALEEQGTTNSIGWNAFTIAPTGAVHVLGGVSITEPFTYWNSPIGSTGVITTISQSVTLPAQMVHPTLSFFHKAMSGNPQGQARLSVRVDDGSEATTVFSAPAAVAWTQDWVDMAPWLGKTVTVTFAVEQADAEPLLAVYLDDISLGPWTTPVISAVEPAQINHDWTGAQLTVRGENFSAASTLHLGTTQLAAVAFVDEHTLQATLPAGLPAGVYDVRVENADGRQNVAPGGFTLGAWRYLPVIRK